MGWDGMGGGGTVWWAHVGDVGVVGEFAGPEGDARGTADGGAAVVAFVKGALVDEMLFDKGHVVEGV